MKKLAEITARYVGKPFREYTCMGLLYSLYTNLGIDVPDHFENLTLDNYMDQFKKDPYGTQITLMRMIRSLGQRSKAPLPHLGDLLIVAQATTRKGVIRPGFLPAMYVGRGQAIASFLLKGVTVFQLDPLNRPIVARRLL
jgi:hypothetical protein